MTARVIAGLFAVCASVGVVSAQSSTTQSSGTTQRSTATPGSSSVTIEGCIQRSASATTPAAPGAAASFILANAMKPVGTSGSTAGPATVATSYRLEAEDSKLSPHVGHKVAVTGMLQDQAMNQGSSMGTTSGSTAGSTGSTGSTGSSTAAGSTSGQTATSGAMAAPRFKVESVKMISANCTAQ